MKQRIPIELLRKANKEHWTRGVVHPNDARIKREPILLDGRVVGFYTPHRSACGVLNIGPIYIIPEARGLGLSLAVYAAIDEPMIACIEDGNTASERLHEKAGFVRWKRYSNGWWWKRDALRTSAE